MYTLIGFKLKGLGLLPNLLAKQTLALSRCFADHFGPGRFPMLVIDSEKTISERTSFSARTAGINGFSMFSRGRCFALNDDLIPDFDAINDFLAANSGKMIFILHHQLAIWIYVQLRFAILFLLLKQLV